MSIKQRIEYLIQQAVSLRASYNGIKLFDLMADAYELRARQLLTNNQVIYNKMYNKAIIDVERIRKRIEHEHPEYVENENSVLIYGIKYKKNFFKIMDNYWDTIKMLQETSVSKLSPKQLELVNQEIEKEFSIEYFKSIMGLNKSKL